MAKYRAISLNFWTDAKVVDDFTPEDRYFYLYLFTNPHTNLCGCYEISLKQMVNETGYSKDTIERLIDRFKNIHKVIDYSPETKEILLINWHKYNWTVSDKFRKPLSAEITEINNEHFRKYLSNVFNGEDDGYGIDTPCIDTPCIDTTVSVSVSVSDKYINIINNNIYKHNYSEYISDSLREWFMYKKEKGQSYKPIGITKLLNKVDQVLGEHSEEELVKVINECMERNYQGIIWDLLNKKNNYRTNPPKDAFHQTDMSDELSEIEDLYMNGVGGQ